MKMISIKTHSATIPVYPRLMFSFNATRKMLLIKILTDRNATHFSSKTSDFSIQYSQPPVDGNVYALVAPGFGRRK